MATHSSVPAWRIPGMGEPGGLPSIGSQRVGHDWSNLAAAAGRAWVSQVALVVKIPPASAGDERDMCSIPGWGRSPGGGHGNPLQYSCLENSMDRGAWWATVHRVAKSRTQLKWLSKGSLFTFLQAWWTDHLYGNHLELVKPACSRLHPHPLGWCLGSLLFNKSFRSRGSWTMKVKVLVAQSFPTLVTPRTVAQQASLSMGFSTQEYWSGLSFLSPGDLPWPRGWNLERTQVSRTAGRFLTVWATREAHSGKWNSGHDSSRRAAPRWRLSLFLVLPGPDSSSVCTWDHEAHVSSSSQASPVPHHLLRGEDWATWGSREHITPARELFQDKRKGPCHLHGNNLEMKTSSFDCLIAKPRVRWNWPPSYQGPKPRARAGGEEAGRGRSQGNTGQF